MIELSAGSCWLADLLLTTILIGSDLLLMRPIWTMGNFGKDTRYHLEPHVFFYQGWSSNCVLISTKLEVLLLELSTLNLSRVCSTLVKCLWACILNEKLKQVKKCKTLDPAYAQNLHDALTEGCSTSTADVDAWEVPCCSRHVVITQRGRLHQSGNRLKQFLLQFLSE